MQRLWLVVGVAIIGLLFSGKLGARGWGLEAGGVLRTTSYALAQGTVLTHTVYLPIIWGSEPPPQWCEPPTAEMGLRLDDLPPGFVLSEEEAADGWLTAEMRALGAVDGCLRMYVSFLWMLVGEVGVVASQVIVFNNAAGPVQFLALSREQALADPAMTLLPGVATLGEETVAVRLDDDEVVAYSILFRRGRFVGRVAGGGWVDVGVAALVGYARVVEGRLE